MITFLLIILGAGFTVQYEDAVAANVTIVPTEDNRVRYSDVRYTDGVVCSVNPKYKEYSYNTYADADAAWQARNPPFALPRGRNAYINTGSCVALTSGIGSNALMCYLFLMLGTPIECFLIAIYRRYKRRRNRDVLPIPLLPPPRPAPQTSLSSFAATMLIDTAIRRGDICPITQEPLTREQTLCVPLCGHIVSESGRLTNNMCPLCRSATTYTVVPPSHTAVTIHASPPQTPPEDATAAESR
jgi:hypothetical protein